MKQAVPWPMPPIPLAGHARQASRAARELQVPCLLGELGHEQRYRDSEQRDLKIKIVGRTTGGKFEEADVGKIALDAAGEWPLYDVMKKAAKEKAETGKDPLIGVACRMNFYWVSKCKTCDLITTTWDNGKKTSRMRWRRQDRMLDAGWSVGTLEMSDLGLFCNAAPPQPTPLARDVCHLGEKKEGKFHKYVAPGK